jgi:ABC-type multidrug transport system fused ATPase/permease subunit
VSLPRVVAGGRRPLMARLLLNGVAQAGAAFAIAWLARGALEAPGAASEAAPEARALRVAGLVIAGLLLLALRALERVDAEHLGQDYVTRVRLRLFERIAALPLRREQAGRFGLTMTRMVSDLNSLRRWVSVGVARMSVATVSVCGILAALAYFDRVAAAVAGGLLALSAVVALGLTPALREQVREARRRRGRLAGNVGEKIFAFGTVRHHGGTRRELRRLRRQSRRMTRALVRRMRLSGLLRSLPDAVFPLAIAVLVFLVGIEGAALSRGDLVVTLLLLGMFTAPVRDLAQAWDYRLSFLEGRRRIEQSLSSPRIRESARAVALPGAGPIGVAFRDVRVEGVLDALTAAAEPGDRVLVTGATGSGKSTLLALAARLFDPDAGEVAFDGISLRRLTLTCVEEGVRLVSPELPLLRGSVAENIAYGIDADAPECVERVASWCGLGASCETLPRGLDTRIEEKGKNLPAGLRARVALARALAAEPRLLLIDDPLFGADPEALAALRSALRHTDATCLLVGSGSLALPRIDRVWRLEAGRLHEEEPGPSLSEAQAARPPEAPRAGARP